MLLIYIYACLIFIFWLHFFFFLVIYFFIWEWLWDIILYRLNRKITQTLLCHEWLNLVWFFLVVLTRFWSSQALVYRLTPLKTRRTFLRRASGSVYFTPYVCSMTPLLLGPVWHSVGHVLHHDLTSGHTALCQHSNFFRSVARSHPNTAKFLNFTQKCLWTT